MGCLISSFQTEIKLLRFFWLQLHVLNYQSFQKLKTIITNFLKTCSEKEREIIFGTEKRKVNGHCQKEAACSQTSPIACKTIFVDFLLSDINPHIIINVFSRHGDIVDLVIPPRLRANCQHLYAFIKFFSIQALLMQLELKMKECWKTLNWELTWRNTTNLNKKIPTPTVFPQRTPAIRDHRSYRETTKPSSKQTANPLPNHEPTHSFKLPK